MDDAATLTDAMEGLVARRQAFDPATAVDEELRRYVLESDRQLARLQADHARVLAAADGRRVWLADGDRSCAAWVARHRHRAKPAVSHLLGLGHLRTKLPAVAVALDEGRIAPEHARELLRCWRFDPEAFARWEADAVALAEAHPWPDFLRLTRHWCGVVDPDGSEDAAAKLRTRRHLLRHRRYDGTVAFHGELGPIAGEVFLRALESIERELLEADWQAARAIHGEDALIGDLPRTHAQRGADALRVLAERAMAMPAGARLPVPNVVVYVDFETLTGSLCELSSGTLVTPRTVASLFAEEPAIDVERIVFGPRNRVIELSVRERFFRDGLARAIRLRDRRCQYEGCDVPAERCHVDHVVDFADGGETTQENGRAGCDRHNIHKKRIPNPAPGWVVDPDPGGGPAVHDDGLDAAIRARVLALVDRGRRRRAPTAGGRPSRPS